MLCKLRSRMLIDLMCARFFALFLLYIIVCMFALGKFDCLNFILLLHHLKFTHKFTPTFILKVSLKNLFCFLLFHIFIIDESFENLNFERRFTFRPFLVLFKGQWIGKLKSWSWSLSFLLSFLSHKTFNTRDNFHISNISTLKVNHFNQFLLL